MDYAIIEFLKGQTEGATSEAIWKAVTAPRMNLARTEDVLDDLIKDNFIALAFVEGKAVYAIA